MEKIFFIAIILILSLKSFSQTQTVYDGQLIQRSDFFKIHSFNSNFDDGSFAKIWYNGNDKQVSFFNSDASTEFTNLRIGGLNINGNSTLLAGKHFNFGSPYSKIFEHTDGQLKIQGHNGILLQSYYGPTNTLHNDLIARYGKVGIGTDSPNEQLTVMNNISVGRSQGYSPIQDARLTDAKGLFIGDAGYILDNNNGYLNLISRSKLNFGVYEMGGTYREALTINNETKVGVGTTAPSARLQVKGQGNNHADKHFIVTDQYNNEDFVIRGSGQVEIGENIDIPNSALYKLAVGGGILAEEVKVQLKESWPDYVFEDTYQLSDLESLETFIQKNKHLPEIPSQAEVTAEGGIELGEMNRLLLQKIEELTLHTIRQEKMINQLIDKVDQLENK